MSKTGWMFAGTDGQFFMQEPVVGTRLSYAGPMRSWLEVSLESVHGKVFNGIQLATDPLSALLINESDRPVVIRGWATGQIVDGGNHFYTNDFTVELVRDVYGAVRDFALWCAGFNLSLWQAPHSACHFIQGKDTFLQGETVRNIEQELLRLRDECAPQSAIYAAMSALSACTVEGTLSMRRARGAYIQAVSAIEQHEREYVPEGQIGGYAASAFRLQAQTQFSRILNLPQQRPIGA